MRLHKPVHPQHQPHHAHSFAKTDTYAQSGQDGAAAGDRHASSGAGFHGGGIPADGRYDPNSIAVAGAGFDDGGAVPSNGLNPIGSILNQTKGPISRIGKQPQQPQRPPDQGPTQEQGGPQRSSDAGDDSGEQAAARGGVIGYAGGGRVKQTNPGVFANMGKGETFNNGVYSPGYIPDSYSDIDMEGHKVPPIQNNGPPSDAVMESGNAGRFDPGPDSGDGGSQGYDSGGLVDPKAYLQWPNHLPGTAGSFAEGGEVNPDAFLGRPDLTKLADHANQVYNDYHAAKERDWNAQANSNFGTAPTQDQGFARGGRVKRKKDPNLWQTDQNDPAQMQREDLTEAIMEGQADPGRTEVDEGGEDQSYAQGGGVPTPPGPAGAGVRPQAPTGNAGRPNWTAPNPTETAAEKNYTQNVTSRPATSPARGTAFSQATPDGGQRGQEWYGKGASPYGAGRKKKNG